MNNVTNPESGDIVLFFDSRTKESPGKNTGCNQIGIFFTNEDILFCRNRKLIKLKLTQLTNTKVIIARCGDNSQRDDINNYLLKIGNNYRLFKLAVRAIQQRNLLALKEPFIMPTFSKITSLGEYENKWNSVISKLQEHDTFFTFDENSYLSKFIAKIDHGSWSHCGIYLGGGIITEVIKHGVVNRQLDIYKQKNIHFGIYRSPKIDLDYERGRKYLEGTLGDKYGYYKALRLGVRTLFGFNEDRFESADLTPNGIIYTGCLYLVDYI